MLRVESEHLDESLHRPIRDEIVTEERAIRHVGEEDGHMLCDEDVLVAEKVQQLLYFLDFGLVTDEGVFEELGADPEAILGVVGCLASVGFCAVAPIYWVF